MHASGLSLLRNNRAVSLRFFTKLVQLFLSTVKVARPVLPETGNRICDRREAVRF